jgi:enoyl-CoA hydratase/carnithine racemase
MALVNVELSDRGVATLTLNDPGRRNAMGLAMAAAFQSAVGELTEKPELRAVIITGAGAAFAAGGDLQMLREKAGLSQNENRQRMLEFYDAFLGIQQLPVPVIAAVNGHAIGAGLCLALACEARVIAETSKLGLTFTKLGLHPGMGATLFLPRLAGFGIAQDLLISGRIFSAEEAMQWRLAQQVVPATDVVATAEAMARSYLESGPEAVAGLLATLRPSPAALRQALEHEASMQAINYAGAEFLHRVESALRSK